MRWRIEFAVIADVQYSQAFNCQIAKFKIPAKLTQLIYGTNIQAAGLLMRAKAKTASRIKTHSAAISTNAKPIWCCLKKMADHKKLSSN